MLVNDRQLMYYMLESCIGSTPPKRESNMANPGVQHSATWRSNVQAPNVFHSRELTPQPWITSDSSKSRVPILCPFLMVKYSEVLHLLSWNAWYPQPPKKCWCSMRSQVFGDVRGTHLSGCPRRNSAAAPCRHSPRQRSAHRPAAPARQRREPLPELWLMGPWYPSYTKIVGSRNHGNDPGS